MAPCEDALEGAFLALVVVAVVVDVLSLVAVVKVHDEKVVLPVWWFLLVLRMTSYWVWRK